jgi:hypothetical protein
VEGRPNKDVSEALGDSILTAESMRMHRKGFLKAMPQLLNDYRVHVDILKKITLGDDCDLYHICYFSAQSNRPLDA